MYDPKSTKPLPISIVLEFLFVIFFIVDEVILMFFIFPPLEKNILILNVDIKSNHVSHVNRNNMRNVLFC